MPASVRRFAAVASQSPLVRGALFASRAAIPLGRNPYGSGRRLSFSISDARRALAAAGLLGGDVASLSITNERLPPVTLERKVTATNKLSAWPKIAWPQELSTGICHAAVHMGMNAMHNELTARNERLVYDALVSADAAMTIADLATATRLPRAAVRAAVDGLVTDGSVWLEGELAGAV